MKSIRLENKKRACECCILTVVIEMEDGTELQQDIDLSGNAIFSAVWGAKEVVAAINTILKQLS